MSDLWQVCSDSSGKAECFEAVEWDAEVSLYNPCSGNTHLLNLFPYEILQFLLLKPATLAAISKHMAILCDENNSKKWNEKILNTLEQLEGLELIDCRK